jgi:hypothetical protein
MNGEKLIARPDPPDERPESEFILGGYAPDNGRKAIREAFHTFAQGDPGGFNVQLAVSYSRHTRKRLNRRPKGCAKPSEPNFLTSVTFC